MDFHASRHTIGCPQYGNSLAKQHPPIHTRKLPSSVPTMPQNNPWSCPVRYHMISHRESAEQFGKSSEKTMIIPWGKSHKRKNQNELKKFSSLRDLNRAYRIRPDFLPRVLSNGPRNVPIIKMI